MRSVTWYLSPVLMVVLSLPSPTRQLNSTLGTPRARQRRRADLPSTPAARCRDLSSLGGDRTRKVALRLTASPMPLLAEQTKLPEWASEAAAMRRMASCIQYPWLVASREKMKGANLLVVLDLAGYGVLVGADDARDPRSVEVEVLPARAHGNVGGPILEEQFERAWSCTTSLARFYFMSDIRLNLSINEITSTNGATDY